MKHLNDFVVCLRYVYVLEVDNRGRKSKYYGHKSIMYTGETDNLVRRLSEHLHKQNSKFLRVNFPDARKKLIFVQQLWGNEYDAMELEWKIKLMNHKKKVEYINSGVNDLVSYVPLKYIILRKFNNKSEQVALKL